MEKQRKKEKKYKDLKNTQKKLGQKGKESGKNGQKPVQEKFPGEWLYMTPQEIGIRQIWEIFCDTDYEVEIWEDAGVLEISMKDGHSMDFETAVLHQNDVITAQYVSDHQVKSVFLVTFRPENSAEAKQVMHKILAKTGGFFCGDTQDFTPVVREVQAE